MGEGGKTQEAMGLLQMTLADCLGPRLPDTYTTAIYDALEKLEAAVAADIQQAAQEQADTDLEQVEQLQTEVRDLRTQLGGSRVRWSRQDDPSRHRKALEDIAGARASKTTTGILIRRAREAIAESSGP